MSGLTGKFLRSEAGKVQLKALNDSIELWRRRIKGDPLHEVECPLCKVSSRDCENCIINIDTGVVNCLGTPYYATDKESLQDCQIMLDWLIFLKSRAWRVKWFNWI